MADAETGLTARELYRELEKARNEAAGYRSRLRQAKEQVESLKSNLQDLADKVPAMVAEHEAEVARLAADHATAIEAKDTEYNELIQIAEEWKTKAETLPETTKKQLEELTGQLRTTKHRDAWGKLVNDKLADKATLDQLWKLAEYQPDTDDIDEAALADRVKTIEESFPYLFRTAQSQADGQSDPGGPQASLKPPPKPLEAGLDGGRGSRPAAKVTVKQSDLMDLDFAKANRSLLADPSKYTLVDG